MQKRERAFADFLENRKTQSNYRELEDITACDARHITVQDKKYLNFSSNDYLGLRHNERVIDAANKAAMQYGAGSGASRLVTGNIDLFTSLEARIAAFKGKEAALIMVSGYQANASILPALFDKGVHGCEPLIFADRLIHASMHAGCAAANGRQIRYAHNDMNHLQSLLEKHKDSHAPKFILSESVFSMDGDIAPLDEIQRLAHKYNAYTVIDDAHASGVLGDGGCGLAHDADIIIGTFGKAFGSFGAYVACSQTMKEYLINKCGGIIYATALPPAVLGSIDAALSLMADMNDARAHLQTLAARFRKALNAQGFDTGASQTHIVPLIIGTSDHALKISATLKDAGFWAGAIRPPTVPENAARIRFALSAAHTDDDCDRLMPILTAIK